MSKQQKLAQQPCENIVKKQNRIAHSSLVIMKETLANDIPQPERNTLFHNDYLHFSVLGNERIIIHWGLSPQKKKIVSFYFNQPFPSFQKQIRIYHASGVYFDGYNASGFKKLIVHDNEGSLIIKGLEAGCSYCLELGIVLERNKFFPLIRSKTKEIPGRREIGEFLTDEGIDCENSKPIWSKAVSTYTLYDNDNNGWSKEWII